MSPRRHPAVLARRVRTPGVLLALAGLLLLPLGAAAQDRPLTRWEQQARAMLKELVEYNTTHVAGDQTSLLTPLRVRDRLLI